MACKRKWWFRYIVGLDTGDSPVPLRTGSLWHQCLAALYRRIQAGTSLIPDWVAESNAITESVIVPWTEQRRSWAFRFFREAFNLARRDEVLAEDESTAEMIKGMLQGYVHDFGESDAAHWEILAVEAQVARWLRHPVTGAPIRDRTTMVSGIVSQMRSRRWAYGGGIDLLVRDRRDGHCWLVEHKTTAETDIDSFLRKLHWDPQIRGYAWALRDPIASSDIREPVTVMGVIYNVARKKVPRIPDLLKDGLALSRAKIDTTRDVYLGAVYAHGFNPDHYADMLDSLKGKTFFGRERYHFTEPNLEDWERDVSYDALAAIATSKSAYFPRTQICTMHGAPDCQFASVCLEDGPMARKNFTTMGIRHAELHGDFAEPYAAQERGLSLDQSTPQSEAVPLQNASASAHDALTADPFAS